MSDDFIESLAFSDLETASAVMYAKARRFCLKYEADAPEGDLVPNLGDVAAELVWAAHRYGESYRRWADKS
jgi:hypothetical protein